MKTARFYNITKNLITGLMICLLGIQILNNVYFIHIHKLSDGTIITHAHPYDKSADSTPYKTHQHSNFVLLFLDSIQIFLLVGFVSIVLILTFQKVEYLMSLFSNKSFSYCDNILGRAPPAFLN